MTHSAVNYCNLPTGIELIGQGFKAMSKLGIMSRLSSLCWGQQSQQLYKYTSGRLSSGCLQNHVENRFQGYFVAHYNGQETPTGRTCHIMIYCHDLISAAVRIKLHAVNPEM